MPLRTCRYCRFWNDDPSFGSVVGGDGECRRRAPTLLLVQAPKSHADFVEHNNAEDEVEPARQTEELRRVFPMVASSDWCGEWEMNVDSLGDPDETDSSF